MEKGVPQFIDVDFEAQPVQGKKKKNPFTDRV